MTLVKLIFVLSLCLLCIAFGPNSPLKSFHRSSRQLDNSYGSPTYKHCECGRSNSPRLQSIGYTRVVGGVETLPNEFPWMAIVVANGSNLVCGGTLINDRYVLTAAHCLNLGKAETKVVLGEHDRCTEDSQMVMLSVEKFHPHPHFQKSTNHADVMLIRLNMRITFNEFIRPICLPKINVQYAKESLTVGEFLVVCDFAENYAFVVQDSTQGFHCSNNQATIHPIVVEYTSWRATHRSTASRFGGQLAWALGWGRADQVAEVCVLRVVALEIYESQFCPTRIPTLICAGARRDGRDACQGDSGGPLQILNENKKFELIGIVSNGIGCGDRDFPGLYTDVPRSLPWIFEVTSQDSMYCWH